MAQKRTKQITAIGIQPQVLEVVEAFARRRGASVRPFVDEQEGHAHLTRQPGDLLIVQVSSTPGDGLEALSRARQTHLWLPIVATVAQEDTSAAVQAMKAGASDCVTTSGNDVRLETALAEGLRRLDPSTYPTREALTPSEIKVLLLVLSGRSSRDIAKSLRLSERTITTHRRNIGRKLGVTSCLGQMRWAIEAGLLTPEGKIR